jgi:hypothetical protein
VDGLRTRQLNENICSTQRNFGIGRKSKLSALASFFLNKEIQTEGKKGHSPVEDAQVSDFYLKGQCHEIFYIRFRHESSSPGQRSKMPKNVRNSM